MIRPFLSAALLVAGFGMSRAIAQNAPEPVVVDAFSAERLDDG